MLNVGIPELPPSDESATYLDDNPEERDPEPALETGENADLDSNSDPVEDTPAPPEMPTLASEPEPDLSSQNVAVPDEPQPAHEPLENFGELLQEFERTHRPQSEDDNKQIEATVVSVSTESVFLDIGFKTEGVLPLTAFAGAKEPPKPGDKLLVTIKTRNEEGYYDLSLLKVAQPKDWSSLEAAFAERSIVIGTVTGAVKGGLTVDVGVRAFMPASRSGARDAADLEKLVGQEIRCRIIKLDVADEDVVVDRRAVLEDEERTTKERRYSEIAEGETVSGVVRSLTGYGAFVDIGGIDALLHISDLAWTRVASPADVLSVGQQIEAKVLKIDPDKRRISIGLKQLQPHPWDAIGGKYTVGERVTGVVTRLTDFGAFVELSPGIEGLIHISEMSWAKKVRKPSDILKPGDTVEAVILSVNPEDRRISLGLKQALGDPWVAAAGKLIPGEIVEGPIVSFTKFGAFVQVAEGVEGMVHISEIAADKRLNHPQDALRIGESVKAMVLNVDQEKRQLKLSIKQAVPTGLDEYVVEHHAGDVVSGRIIEASAGRLLVELGEGIRVTCKPPAAAAAPPKPAKAEAAPATAAKTDLSALSSMLSAKWKSGPAAASPSTDAPNKKADAIRAGQVRSFRITSLDPAAKKIEIEPV